MSTRATTVLTVAGHDRPDRGDRILVNGIADQASELTSACVAKRQPASPVSGEESDHPLSAAVSRCQPLSAAVSRC
jgi:hypothetical protein